MKTDSVRVLLALVVATALGLLIAAANDARLIALADQLVPIGTLWVNAIRMTVIPLVVSLLVTGVASTTDVAAIGRLGARTVIVFVLLPAGMAVVMMPIIAAVFAWLPPAASRPPLPPGASEAASQVVASEAPTLAAWLTSLIPSNPVSAAADGAMVPLIIFTLLFALALTRAAASARNTLLSLFQAVAETMLTLVGWVILAAPIGIFALILPLAAHAGSALVGGIGFYIVAYSMLSIVATLLLYPATAVFGGVSIRRFARAALAPQLIAFSSSSSIASLPALVASAETELCLPKRTTGFVLPLAVSTLKVAGPVSWTVGALFIGWFYGINLGRSRAGDRGVCRGVPGIRGTRRSARRVHHADAAAARRRAPRRRGRHPHRSGRAPRRLCNRAQRHGRSGRRCNRRQAVPSGRASSQFIRVRRRH